MDVTFEKSGNVGIFTLRGELTTEQEDDLKILLMRAIHSIERSVLNFKKVTKIDDKCRELLRKAYCTSIRLKAPIIMTEIPGNYISEIFNCEVANNVSYSFNTNWPSDIRGSDNVVITNRHKKGV